MAQEIEVKYRLDDPEALRARLEACGAEPAGRVLETNTIFDAPDRKLEAGDCALRLRTCRVLEGDPPAGATLTYKGPRAAGTVKAREELETAVADSSAVAAILRRLGLCKVILYEKRRETWRLDDCQICLDELPVLGAFIEIEGPSLAAIRAVVERLNLSQRTPLRKTYVDMTASVGRPDTASCAELRFEPPPAT